MKLDNGETITDSDQIIKQQELFYHNLLTSQSNIETTINDFLKCEIPQLSEREQISCEGKVEIIDCEKVLKTFKSNKTPGNDGLPIEFYITFWDEIKQLLVDSFNYAFTHGELSTSQKQAVISLLQKKGKDRLFLKNWRPISLLNVDYKILSKVIAERIRKILPSVIHFNQSGFIEDRYIGDALRTIMDAIEYTDYYNKEGLMMMIDFEKAYDSLEWNYMFDVLQRFNFGPELIKWVKLFYSNIESCVTNNNITSKYFKISRGLRQGDPLSSYIFVLCVEVLAIAIRNNPKIEGISINKNILKLVQYADDTTVIVQNLKSAEDFFRILEDFRTLSGLKINKDKTEALWLGVNKNNRNKPLGIKWSDEPIKVLGVFIGNNYKQVLDVNFSSKIKKLKQHINTWKQRNLSLLGRILILKTFGVSQFVYLAGLLPFPTCKMKEINEIMYEYVWKGKIDKVKRSIMIQDYQNGGLRMPDLESINCVHKIKYIKQVIACHEAFWINSMQCLIGVKNLSIFVHSNFNLKDFSNISPFYYEVLTCLDKVKCTENDNVFNEFIFYNKNIKIDRKYIFSEELLFAGIWKIGDLYNNKKLITFHQLQKRGVPFKCYLMYRGIIDIVKNLTQKVETQGESTEIHVKVDNRLKTLQESTSKNIYDSQVVLKNTNVKSKIKYSLLFDVDDESWKSIYSNIIYLTYDNKLKEFQFKIVHRFLGTNSLVYKIGKKDTPRCTFCNLYEEKIEHLFYYCVCVKHIWLNIENLIVKNNLLSEIFHFNAKDVILGFHLQDVSNNNIIINKLILYSKFYIWQSKLNSDSLNMNSLYSCLRYHMKYDCILNDCNLSFD